MKILLNALALLAILVAGIYLGERILQSKVVEEQADHSNHGVEARGPHGGRLLEADGLKLEITIYERGTSPEFRVYAYRGGKPVDPDTYDVEITLSRLGGRKDRFTFKSRADYRVSNQTVTEPHSFDVRVRAQDDSHNYSWNYAQHEGRTTISADQADAAGIETVTAGPATIRQTIRLQGRVHYDAGRVRQIRARYPGLIRDALKSIGDQVSAGETLAKIESNNSLQTYIVTAPTDAVVITQHSGAGEAIGGEQPIYTVANTDRVWVDLAVFPQQMKRVDTGMPVRLQSLDGGLTAMARIDYLMPATDSSSQATNARVYLDNPDGNWRPGMAVNGTVVVEEVKVPLAVRNSALQVFRDFDVVYARFGETYEVRMLQLGRSDETHTEVLDGIESGTEYVTSNSFLIKADIEKSGATHAH